ncbi:Protein-export membrane protein SecF (TC 3.A.5.1.1) [Pseudoalteromonas luteoviolacea B = ATCC 29581]|nr:Protein-export membrane protein SecF (TC 3.A.5.1.1) [Pseudoalteromonas luteoviolacea B = ATCC 29581]
MVNFWNKIRTLGLVISTTVVILSTLVIWQKGLVFGQDFTGGYVSEFQLALEKTPGELKYELAKHIDGEFRLTAQGALQWQVFQPPQSTNTPPLAWQTQLPSEYGFTIVDSRFVGAQVGAELIEQGSLAMFVSLIAVGIYLIFRFEWRLAVSASVALLHDVLITVAWFSLTGMEFDLTVLAALLAIIGYSLNDSIIIADKVRELVRARPNTKVSESINKALGSTLGRTTITSSTTLTTVVAIWMLGGASLSGFAIALFVGIIVGTWSSIFIAATLPQWMGLRFENYQTVLSEQEQQQLAQP